MLMPLVPSCGLEARQRLLLLLRAMAQDLLGRVMVDRRVGVCVCLWRGGMRHHVGRTGAGGGEGCVLRGRRCWRAQQPDISWWASRAGAKGTVHDG